MSPSPRIRPGKKGALPHPFSELYSKIGHLTTQVNCALGAPEKNLAGEPSGSLSRNEREVLVERDESELPLTVQAGLLSAGPAFRRGDGAQTSH